MRSFLFSLLCLVPIPALSQTAASMAVHLEVLPAVLTLSVTSTAIDFGAVYSGEGTIVLDPVTGHHSPPPTGGYHLAEVWITGPPGSNYLVSIQRPSHLQGYADSAHSVPFALRWAQNNTCAGEVFEAVPPSSTAPDVLGSTGCTILRFGGEIDVQGAASTNYTGKIHVTIAAI